MTVWVSKKEEEENINKKKLLYDGHGTGVDKRLLSILKEVTKFCLVDEPIDQIQNTYTQICEAINASIVDAERNEKILDVCRTDLSITCAAVEQEAIAIKKAKSEIEKARLDLEYETKVKIVNELPNCNLTESRIKALEDKRNALIKRMEKHRMQLQKIISVCDEFEKILSDNGHDDKVESNTVDNLDQPMIID